ncbi:MAG: class I SAM-dependent methyltransferase [Chitinophagaceae bacterium]|nr:class I SAM-dependent methyltransferase [Chitinophagaceae bacterium]
MSDKSNSFFSNAISGIFFNPYFLIRQKLYQAIADIAPMLNGMVVDLGCGTKPYRHLFTSCSNYLGLDIEVSGNTDSKAEVDIYYDGKTFPMESDSVDHVFSSETFEHIFNLEEILQEIHRVLKPGGLLLATCPFFWPEHEKPYDFARYSSFGLMHLLKKNGFEIVQYRKTGTYVSSMIQMQALYLYFFVHKIPLVSYLFFWLLITPLFLVALFLETVLPQRILRNDLYLNNIILAKKI